MGRWRQWRWAGLLALWLVAWPALAQPLTQLTVVCYHEITEPGTALIPAYALSPATFEMQLRWMREEGYRFVSLQQVIDARAGRAVLPPKAMLLSFDDGYASVYRNAWPVLRRERIPAMLALVGQWMDVAEGQQFDFDGKPVAREQLMTWAHVREMQASGLVEVASHSQDMHRGIVANPQGNLEPAATALQWLPARKRYETVPEYRARLRADLTASSASLRRALGTAPRAIVWPYGRYNRDASAVAASLGMRVGFNLDDGPNTAETPLTALRRELVMGRENPAALADGLRQRADAITDEGRPTKAAQIDLDYIYDPDPVLTEDNLGRLLDRVQRLGINTVYLQAFADPDANGAADALYFPNRHLPMRADLFNRVAWQLLTRTQVKRVYAWMPLLAWQPPASDPVAAERVVTLPNKANHLAMGYPRLSPFSPRVRTWVREIYEDLGRHATFDGLLFHDDVTLSDYEDASPAARQQYRAWGFRQGLQQLRADPALLKRWAARKTRYLDDFAMQIAAATRELQPPLLTARNLYAQVALNPEAEGWYSQSLPESLRRYDYTAIMVMPYMEQAADVPGFYRDMVARVRAQPQGIEKTVFELQAVNWRANDAALAPTEVPDTIRLLYGLGVRHVGYYPDNVFHNVPDADLLRRALETKPNTPAGSPLQ